MASVELEFPSQLTSPVVVETCQLVLDISKPEEFLRVSMASVVVIIEF